MEKEKGRRNGMESLLPSKILKRRTTDQRSTRPKSYDFAHLPSTTLELNRNTNDETDGSIQSLGASANSGEEEVREWDDLIGHHVCIGGIKEGILRYYGHTKFADGLWCGVELQEAVGKNDGTVSGVRYFHCQPNHGIFAPVTKVSLLSHDRLNNCVADHNFYRKQELPQHALCSDLSSLKPSSSDSRFQNGSKSSFCSYIEEGTNFLGDKRNITEQREKIQACSIESGSFVRRYTTTDDTSALPYVFNNHPSTSNVYAHNEYRRHSMDRKSTEMFAMNKIAADHVNFPRKIMSEYSLSTNVKKTALTQSHSCPYAVLKGTDVERFTTRVSPSKTSQILTSDRELDPKFSSSHCQPSFRSYVPSAEFFDFQDDNDDDQMSLDYDESLGILTPSEMKDFTLCADLPTSRSDTRAIGFPSSESFDEVNDLPEDEQVHDVSVQYITSGSSSFMQTVAVTKSNAEATYTKHNEVTQHESGIMKHTINTTDKFLTSISSKNMTAVNFGTVYAKDDCRLPVDIPAVDSQAICTNRSDNFNDAHVFTAKRVKLPEIPANESCGIKFGAIPENIVLADEEALDARGRLSPRRYDSNMRNRRNYETDSSRDSLLQNEEHTVSKEKLTVSWEDRVTDSPDEMYSKIERPESVYTVGSSDTGYQEDGEFEPDTGMTTSLESSEGKRFSTFSRDSGAPEEDIDVDKVGESTSTSGYSTGLSDFCCNDRHDEGMCRPMEDSFQDVGDSCNSDDAMVFVTDSNSRDGHGSLEKSEGFFDMDSFKDPSESESDFHITESSTVLGLHSTCETLSETVIEDVTIVDMEQRSLETSSIQDTTNLDETVKCNGTLPLERTPNIYTGGDTRSTTDKASKEPKRQNIFNVLTSKKDPVQEGSDSTKKQDVRSPRRNVMSKIKAVIGGNRSKSSDSNEQPKKPATPRKSRWEAVTSKIAASLAEEKTKVKGKKEIRSRVDTNLTAARQTCRSPRLDMSSASEGKGDISGASSASSKSRKIMSDRQRTLTKKQESRSFGGGTVVDHGPKSPRPSKTRSSSRSTSPVAVSESSTSVSLTSHHSRSKIAIWKGSNSTVASSVAPTIQIKKLSSTTTLRTTCSSSRVTSREAPKNLTAAKLRVNASCPLSPRLSSRLESSTKSTCTKFKSSKEQGSGGMRPLVAPRPVRPPMWLSKAELSQEIQHLSTLCETRTKELNRLKMETRHATTGFDALAVVIRYMSTELNAFGNPTLATDLKEAQENLTIGKKNLEYYENEIEKLNLLHVKEVNTVSEKLVKEHDGKLQELIKKQNEQVTILTEKHEKEARTLTEALKASCDEEKQQQQKMLDDLHQELKKQREEMEIFHQHELDDLEDVHLEKHKSLMMEVEKLQKQCEDAKVLSLTMEDALQKDTDSKLQWLSAKKLDLQNEVDSLKAVLEIKNNELHSLRKENLEMQKELEDLPLARERIKMLQARAEDLQALMAEKVRLERQLSTEHESMKEIYEREEKINKRLSMENEELVWRLKQANESSLLSTTVPDEDETEEYQYPEASDLSSSCPPAVFEPHSPVKSPKPLNSRPMFFTYMNQDELNARSPQSPRTQYKRIQPHKGSKSGSHSPSPHTSRRSTDSSPHTSEATPRKMARQISRNAKDMSRRRGRDGSSESKAGSQAGSIPDSLLSSASSETSLFDPRLLEDHSEQISVSLQILQEQRSTDASSLNFTSEINLSLVNANEDIDVTGEVFDPKTYYHMTFPVKDAAPDGEDAIKETARE